jgi:hypothetical protein
MSEYDPMLKVGRILFGVSAWLYTVYLLFLMLTGMDSWLDSYAPYWALTFIIVLGIIFFIPFVLTYSWLGLNEEEPSHETKRRWRVLIKECPNWTISWLGLIAALVIIWGIAWLGDCPRANPFVAIAGAMSFISGTWLLCVYPKAIELFGSR